MGEIEKRPYSERPPLKVEAFGQQFLMKRCSANGWVRVQRGDDNGELIGLALDAIVDSSLPDGTEIDLDDARALVDAWVNAHRDDAVPPG